MAKDANYDYKNSTLYTSLQSSNKYKTIRAELIPQDLEDAYTKIKAADTPDKKSIIMGIALEKFTESESKQDLIKYAIYNDIRIAANILIDGKLQFENPLLYNLSNKINMQEIINYAHDKGNTKLLSKYEVLE